MVFRKIFHSIYPPPDSVPAESRKATLYLLRCVFLMGIRTPPQHFTSHILSVLNLEYFAFMGACFQDVCVDCYPINFVLPLRAHLTHFADRLRQLGSDPDETSDQRYQKLVDCIENHNVILSFCDTLRPMIGGTIFVQLLVVGLVLVLTIINIVIFSDIGSRISAMSFMIGVLLETTLFSILCNYLADDCNKLADALFESNWIDQEQRYRKTN
ncbi:GH23178 [Drosophila grimshawi]|uniref:GH23178 n=1 Tax=Drosophila grimshawi TaxID=7222 RepID=B4K2L6_DROGR|nr:GH23178 [Drosophila grimshawi]